MQVLTLSARVCAGAVVALGTTVLAGWAWEPRAKFRSPLPRPPSSTHRHRRIEAEEELCPLDVLVLDRVVELFTCLPTAITAT